ncbi:ABC transporter permease [Kineococcus sp. SYSU DK004]|uniref:ABC transporter permease n=1 Tax=Kineococcus sp. SYSU DK004 TaxID=3383125 RepID=UPI003D7DD535
MRSALHPRTWVPTVVALLAAGAVWTLVARDNPYVLPRLSAVGSELAGDPGFYAANAATTLGEALLGLLVGAVAAFCLGVAVSESALLRRAVMPLAVVLNVTPVVAVVPALIVAFGFGMTPKVVVTALVVFFPVLMNTTTGLRSVPRPVLQVFGTVAASRLDVLLRVRVPYALPYLFSALRVAFPLSLVGAVVAELLAAGATRGLGTVISVASSNSQLGTVWAAIACLALLGALLLLLVSTVERRVLGWHESQRPT